MTVKDNTIVTIELTKNSTVYYSYKKDIDLTDKKNYEFTIPPTPYVKAISVTDKAGNDIIKEFSFTEDSYSGDTYKYTVTFDLNGYGGDTAPDSQSIYFNGLVTKPTSPTDAEYDFVGWYKDKDCTEEWTFKGDTADAIYEDTTIYAKWEKHSHTDTDDDNRCDSCGTLTGSCASLAGYSLSLTGNIGVKFYMEISDDVVSTGYMTIKSTSGELVTIYASEATKDTTTKSGITYYVFPYEVNAKEMTDTITASFYDSESETAAVTYTYTVQEYAETILNDTTGTYDSAKPLVKAMLNYGAYAQTYFGYAGDNGLANSVLSDTAVSAVTNALTEKTVTDNIDGIEYYGSSLLLNSKTTIRHYFKVTDTTKTYTYNGNALTSAEVDGYYYVDIANISADDYDETDNGSVTITSSDNTTLTVTYCVNSYIKDVLTDGSGASESLTNVVKALYAYGVAAKAYIG